MKAYKEQHLKLLSSELRGFCHNLDLITEQNGGLHQTLMRVVSASAATIGKPRIVYQTILIELC